MPTLLCICGPNGAGKSTFSRAIAMRENLLVIDPDKLAAEGLSPIAAGKAAARMAHLFLEEGVSFARESTLTARFDFTLMAKAKQRVPLLPAMTIIIRKARVPNTSIT